MLKIETTETDKSKSLIKSLPGMHVFEKYIDKHLAGDFAYTLAKVLKMSIHITNEEYEFLKQCQQEMKTQDNRATRNPCYVVRDVTKESCDPEFTDEYLWIESPSEDGSSWTDEELIDYFLSNEVSISDEELLVQFDTNDIPGDDIKAKLLFALGEMEDEIRVDDKNYYRWYYQEISQVKDGSVFSWFASDAENEIKNRPYDYTNKVHTYACANIYGHKMNKLQDLIINLKMEA